MHDIRNGTCPLCQHGQVLESWPADWNGGSANRIAAANSISTWGRVTDHGPMAAYICLRCGYTQWFTANPAEIPVGPEFGTRILGQKG